MLQEHISQIAGVDSGAARNKVLLFRESIHYHPESIVIL